MVGTVSSSSGRSEGRPYLASSQARSTYSMRGRCAWWRDAAGRARPGMAREFRQAVQRQVDLAAMCLRCESGGWRRRNPASRSRSSISRRNVTLRIEVGGHYARLRSLRRFPAPRRARGRRAPACLATAALVRISAPRLRAAAAMASETAPMPPRTNPHSPRWPPTPPIAVVQQNVGRARRARAAVGADHAIGGERDLHLARIRTTRPGIRRRFG